MALSRLSRIHANNISTILKTPLAEISGALGDLGTLLPLMIALAIGNSISLSTTLVFCGVWNIITGIVFGVPLPVQPMKAIAAVAISRSFTISETMSAGFTVSGVVFIFSITGLLRWFTHAIPIPVVKGIQVGAGLSLVLSAGSSLLQPLGWMSPNWADNLFWSLSAFILLLITQKTWRFPYALVVFVVGLILSFCMIRPNRMPSFKIWHPEVFVPSWKDFKTGSLDAGLGQIPLTTLNSIIAVSYLSADLLPNLPAPTVTAMGISVALMNLVGGWFGSMPVCHGSGGLAAQYRFGARSGASIILLGFFKILLGVVFGETLVGFLRQYPKSLLGIMVLAAGLELAKVGESLNRNAADLWEDAEPATTLHNSVWERETSKKLRQVSDEEKTQRWTVMLMTVGGLLAFKNDAVGFVAGMLCHWTYRYSFLWFRRKQQNRERDMYNSSLEPDDNNLGGEERQLLVGP